MQAAVSMRCRSPRYASRCSETGILVVARRCALGMHWINTAGDSMSLINQLKKAWPAAFSHLGRYQRMQVQPEFTASDMCIKWIRAYYLRVKHKASGIPHFWLSCNRPRDEYPYMQFSNKCFPRPRHPTFPITQLFNSLFRRLAQNFLLPFICSRP